MGTMYRDALTKEKVFLWNVYYNRLFKVKSVKDKKQIQFR